MEQVQPRQTQIDPEHNLFFSSVKTAYSALQSVHDISVINPYMGTVLNKLWLKKVPSKVSILFG
jgi:hypothetical protein